MFTVKIDKKNIDPELLTKLFNQNIIRYIKTIFYFQLKARCRRPQWAVRNARGRYVR